MYIVFCSVNNVLKKGKEEMEKLITIQKKGKLNEVVRVGQKGPGGAHHDYAIVDENTQEILAAIEFQNGPRTDPEARRGVIDSDLLEIVRDRLREFQGGEFACKENAWALNYVEAALMWMNRRVENRIERNVLGTMQK